jgi:AraC-like DNA-binding protein
LYVLCVSAVLATERVIAWRPAVPGISEVLHAEFHAHAYPPHTHDTWNVFIVDEGQIRYDLDRHHRGAGGSMVGVLPPHVVHDGRPATSRGYRKRVLYLDTSVLSESLVGRAVDEPCIEDIRLRRRLNVLHERLRHPDDALEAESHLAFVAERLRAHLEDDRADEGDSGGVSELAERLRELLDTHEFEVVTLAAAGELLGASPAHLVRCFSQTFGIAPHAYVLGRRIEAARQRLLEGEPIVQVAAAVGFCDQAHLTRHFKRHVGTTPGLYGRSSGGSRRGTGEALISEVVVSP